MWQWWNKYAKEVPPGKKVLRINMDETSIRLFPGAATGMIVRRAPTGEPSAPGKVALCPATRRQQRGAFSLVAFICDDEEIQRALPQILVAASQVLNKATATEARAKLHKNVFLLRRKSAWVNKPLLVEMLQLLSEVLKPWKATHQPVLTFDALPAHLAPEVLRAAGKANIWSIVLPAKLTGLLQPLDTDVFARLKAFLRRKYVEAAGQSDDGQVFTSSIIASVNDACKHVLCGYEWGPVFDKNGLQANQENVRASILRSLEWESCPSVGSAMPSLQQLQDIWPAGKQVAVEALFHQFLRKPGPSRRVSTESLPPLEDTTGGMEPWSKRLRPRHHRGAASSSAGAAADSQVSESSAPPAEPWPAPPLPPPALPPPPREGLPLLPRARRLGPPLHRPS